MTRPSEEYEREIESLIAALASLRAALAPFAAMAETMDGRGDGESVLAGVIPGKSIKDGWRNIEIGDFRRAALAGKE